ncbi:hypothetical protein [Phenylobacterium sp.]|uniref:hypothetical protein n=1 Tax=Phenylobacterium sp. TaxID=1871053 RepID=UPI002F9455B1
MPRPMLRAVAWLIGLGALSSFSLALYNASPPGRLPGEGPRGKSGAGALQAMEATPLSQERIEGPPPPPELTPEEKAKQEADAKAKAEAARLARLEAEQVKAAETTVTPATPVPAAEPAPPTPAEKAPPPPEDPPF